MPRIIPIAILFRAILCEKFSRSSSRYALRSLAAKNNAEIAHSLSTCRDTCASAYLHQDGAEEVIYKRRGEGGTRKGEARKRKIRCKYLDIVYSKRAKSDVSDLIIRVTIENESEKKEKFDRTSVMDG